MKRNVILLVFSLLLSVVLCEGILRSFGMPLGMGGLHVGNYQISGDPLIRYEYKRNAEIEVPRDRLQEGQADAKIIEERGWGAFRTNSHGFRDREFSIQKQKGVIRVAGVGDSVTAGLNLQKGDRWTEQLEHFLNPGKSTGYEVYNFGVGGYDTLQEAETIRKKVIPFDPDIVVLQYCLNDDSFFADGGIHQILLDRQTDEYKNWISYLYYDSMSGFQKVLFRFKLFKLVKYFYVTKIKRRIGNNQAIGFTHKDIVGQGFKLIHRVKKHKEFKLMVVIFPNFQNLEDNPYQSSHDMVKEKAKPYGFKVIDLYETFFKNDRNHGDVYVSSPGDYCHPNPFGHRLAAEKIGRAIIDLKAQRAR